jgi:hypothetical protein
MSKKSFWALIVIGPLAIYLILAFISSEANVTKWHAVGRFVYVILVLTAWLFILLDYMGKMSDTLIIRKCTEGLTADGEGGYIYKGDWYYYRTGKKVKVSTKIMEHFKHE